MRYKKADNSFGCLGYRLKPIRITRADSERFDHGGRATRRWFVRVYNHFMHNGAMHRNPDREF